MHETKENRDVDRDLGGRRGGALHGCVSAYNLDGGISATMIFLGNKINRHGEEDYYGVQSSPRVMPDGLTWGYSPAHYGAYRNPA